MAKAETQTRRCAIYTRKSSEEGLEQDFNSLDAQREACEAYIRSQKSEGWKLVETGYDDGGYSGGTMERPALKRLLADIEQGRVQTVVVYKVDRLTRSLSDFAKIVDVLDSQQVSFVSVTQQFNTTTSMGRLTLNMLLSFAQFEREVTGERIRDKIAASKRKGLWMGGLVPIGYEPNGRTLEVVESEAETVRTIFRLYLNLGTVRKLTHELKRLGLRSKYRPGKRGRAEGGGPFTRNALYHILKNPLYIGRIRHRSDSHEGQHPAIVDTETWNAAQKLFAVRARAEGPIRRTSRSHVLTGKLIDEQGISLKPTASSKDGRKYRYYVTREVSGSKQNSLLSQYRSNWRLSAHEIESTIERCIRSLFADSLLLTRAARKANVRSPAISELLSRAQRCDRDLLRFVHQVHLEETQLTIELCLSEWIPNIDANIQHCVPFRRTRRGGEARLIVADEGRWAQDSKVDSTLMKAVARARSWFDDLAAGRVGSLLEISKGEGLSDRYIGNLIPLAFLAPEIVHQITDGNQPEDLTTESLRRDGSIPSSWLEQKALLRMNRKPTRSAFRNPPRN